MRKTFVIVLSLLAVTAALLGFYDMSYVASRGGETAPLYSTRRYDPYGTAALDQLLRERGVRVQELQRPRLHEYDHGTLIQILPGVDRSHAPAPHDFDFDGLSSHSIADLLDWIADGNTLIICTRHRCSLLDRLGLDSSSDDVAADFDLEKAQSQGAAPGELPAAPRLARWLQPSPVRAAYIVLNQPQKFDMDQSPQWKPLASERGDVVAAERPYHRGRVIAIGAPTIALNQYLGEGDNLAVMLELIGKGPAIFDNWSLGIGHNGSVIEVLAQFGLIPLILQCLLFVAVYHWSTRGHPPAADFHPSRSRAAIEEINALAHLYRRALPQNEIIERTRLILLGRVARQLRCLPADVPQRLMQRSRQAADRWADITRTLDTLSRGGANVGRHATDRRLIELMQTTQKLCRELPK